MDEQLETQLNENSETELPDNNNNNNTGDLWDYDDYTKADKALQEKYETQASWDKYYERDNDSIYPPNWPYPAFHDDITLEEIDPVRSPSHYQLLGGEVEVKDIIKDRLTQEEWLGYIKGNMLKYHLRMGYKENLEQDLNKMLFYGEWLQEELANV
jgi:hypothetical protein